MTLFWNDLKRRQRGAAAAAVSPAPLPRLAGEEEQSTLRIELLEERSQPGVVWGT